MIMKSMDHYHQSNLLNFETLEEGDGKIDAQPIHDDHSIREWLLTDENNRTRTYAVTIKKTAWLGNEETPGAGSTLLFGRATAISNKTTSYNISTNAVEVYVTSISEWLQLAFEHKSETLEIRITEFSIMKNYRVIKYGIITEIYSPGFHKQEVDNGDKAQINVALKVLHKLGFSNEEISLVVKERSISPQIPHLHASFVAAVKEKSEGNYKRDRTCYGPFIRYMTSEPIK